jgi:hypothetical protein
VSGCRCTTAAAPMICLQLPTCGMLEIWRRPAFAPLACLEKD